MTSPPPTPDQLSSSGCSNVSSPSSSHSRLTQSLSVPNIPSHHSVGSTSPGSVSSSHPDSVGSHDAARLTTPTQFSYLMSPKLEEGANISPTETSGGVTIAALVDSKLPVVTNRVKTESSSAPEDVLAQVIQPPAGMKAMNANHQKPADVRRSRRPFKQSTVWDHFLKLSDGNVQCVHCAKILKRKDSSTKTMWGHLRAIHYKGRDWTALQQQAQSSHAAPSDPLTYMEECAMGDIAVGSAQSWLEEQLGISNTPNHDENRQNPKLGPAISAEYSELEPQEGRNLKRAYGDGANDVTPTQPYVKRNRPTGYSPNASNVNELYMNSAKLAPPNHGLSAVRAALALQQHRNTDDKKTMNFLAMIPRSSEVINITAGFSGEEEGGSSKNGTDNCTIDENGDECGVEMESRNGSGSGEIPTPSTSAQSNNQLNAAAILSAAASNPFVYMAAANAIAANGMSSSDKRSTFSLMDGDSVVTLMRVAAELDCTFSFHCRDGQAHFCFETNQTVIDKIRGAEVSLVDVGSEVRVTEWNNGIETDSEMWKKTDWAQFTWAIRGKCQKVLKR